MIQLKIVGKYNIIEVKMLLNLNLAKVSQKVINLSFLKFETSLSEWQP